ncbi:MAG TPA: class I SAM-dependent methyltransferase [Terriglobales bacterium]|nr:class I SAM-dependent methyltransferase [Terriglobales bacterium]
MTRRSRCRACDGTRLTMVLSLGEVPLANSFLCYEELRKPEMRVPLAIYFCADCALVQLLDVVEPQVLFSNYIYRTGTNQTIAQHNAALADSVIRELGLSAADLVIEIASNDGSLLQCFAQRGVRTLGVEPASNIAQIARTAGIDTIVDFFGPRSAPDIARQYGLASVVIANNVLAHVDATADFLEACKTILRPDGRLVIEVPYLVEMLDRLEYDTIYHEHLCYFAVQPLLRLFAKAGLALERIDRVPIHGGSLRLWARHADASGHSQAVLRMAQEECAAGLADVAAYCDFARRVAEHRDQLSGLLHRLKDQGSSIVGYGAPAKGNTLLCYCGIGNDVLAYIVDRSPLKVGLYTPGMHIPVVPVERLLQDQPDYVLILAWNFAEEIMKALSSFRDRGGHFILPIPEPRSI